MNIIEHHFAPDQFLFQFENGPTWTKQVLTLQHSMFGIDKLSIELTTNAAGWVNLKSMGLFGYTPEICGPIFGGGFNPSKPYLITVEMHSNDLTLLAILDEGESSVENWLKDPTVANALADSTQFLLISTMQPISPSSQWGMSTIFSQSHHQ